MVDVKAWISIILGAGECKYLKRKIAAGLTLSLYRLKLVKGSEQIKENAQKIGTCLLAGGSNK